MLILQYSKVIAIENILRQHDNIVIKMVKPVKKNILALCDIYFVSI